MFFLYNFTVFSIWKCVFFNNTSHNEPLLQHGQGCICSAVAAAVKYLELLLAVWCLRGQMNKDQLSITL